MVNLTRGSIHRGLGKAKNSPNLHDQCPKYIRSHDPHLLVQWEELVLQNCNPKDWIHRSLLFLFCLV